MSDKEIIFTALSDHYKNGQVLTEHIQRLCSEYEETIFRLRNHVEVLERVMHPPGEDTRKILEETIFELRNHVEVLERDNFLLMKDKVESVANVATKKKRPNKSRVQST